jgi:spore cortex formation protein SpoVR/YcgB (stage V sporulation)
VLKHLHRLWGFNIHLEVYQGEQLMSSHHVPPKTEPDQSSDYPRLDLMIPPI